MCLEVFVIQVEIQECSRMMKEDKDIKRNVRNLWARASEVAYSCACLVERYERLPRSWAGPGSSLKILKECFPLTVLGQSLRPEKRSQIFVGESGN